LDFIFSGLMDAQCLGRGCWFGLMLVPFFGRRLPFRVSAFYSIGLPVVNSSYIPYLAEEEGSDFYS